MDLMVLVATVIFSIALGFAASRAILSGVLFLMTRWILTNELVEIEPLRADGYETHALRLTVAPSA